MADPLPQPELTPLPPQDAIDFFRGKGLSPSFAWQDVYQDEHAYRFTVAKAMQREVLEAIRAEVDAALANGTTFETFRDQLEPKLRELGWWGKQQQLDPATGRLETVQLGSPRRLKLIFSLNLRSASAAGKWQRIQAAKALAPYLRYVQLQRPSKRDEHAPFHNVIRMVDDPWWDQHYPPCDWQCGCYTQQLNERQMKKRGWTVTPPPKLGPPVRHVNKRTGEVTLLEPGIAPGFGFNVGKAYLRPAMPRPAVGQPVTKLDAAGERAIQSFLSPFGVKPAGERVFIDAGDFPVPVGASLFRAADGGWRLPEAVAELPKVARAIIEPSEIRWIWRPGADGRQVLIRRYLAEIDGETVVVDMGARTWSWRIAPDGMPGRAPADSIAWRPGEASTSARLVGRADPALADFARQAMARGSKATSHDGGDVDAEAAAAVLKATRINVAGYRRVFPGSEVRHAIGNHGDRAVEADRRQLPIDEIDIALIPEIVARAFSIELKGERAAKAPQRIVYLAMIGGRRYEYVETIAPAARRLAFKSLKKG